MPPEIFTAQRSTGAILAVAASSSPLRPNLTRQQRETVRYEKEEKAGHVSSVGLYLRQERRTLSKRFEAPPAACREDSQTLSRAVQNSPHFPASLSSLRQPGWPLAARLPARRI